MRYKLATTIAVLSFLYLPFRVSASVVFEDDFDGYSMPRGAIDDAGALWSGMGSSVVVTDTGCKSGKCIKATYTAEGYADYVFSKTLSTPLAEGYYSFWFKLENNAGCGGSKFLKLRAITNSSIYSNVTTQMKYENSSFSNIDFGCGTGDIGDQGCGGSYNNSYDWNQGTVLTYTSSWTIPNNEWHHYELYIKWNTDGNSDGKYTVWLDGVKRREVINTKMRASSSPAGTTHVLLSDYFDARSCSLGSGYSLYYDDVVVSTTYMGAGDPPPSTITCYQDADNDLYGHGVSETVETCSSGYYIASHFTALTGDCNDNNANINPGTTDICGNGIDEDCSGADAVCQSGNSTPISTGTMPISIGTTPITVQ